MRKNLSKRAINITKQDLIEDVQKDFGGKYSKREIEDILNSFWDNIVYYLKNSEINESVIIRPFLGIKFISRMERKREQTGLGKSFTFEKRRRVKAEFSQYFKRQKINDLPR